METAVIKTGGKQYVVSKGLRLNIEKLPGTHKEGDKITFEEVLMVDNGSDTTIGDPFIKGATVQATVLELGKADKIDVVKFKAKSRYYKRRGHRQPFVKVQIDSIS